MWYLSPEALTIIAGITAKPPVEQHSHTYAITVDRWNEFTGPQWERLKNHWHAVWDRSSWSERDALLSSSPEDVLGALWGDPNGNEHFRTHRDLSAAWERIRRDVAGALDRRAAA
ncbi:hypothetical protein [Novosphingobium olei]|uniref:Uncharacterized protein n=1 Tax=Novosphingobium olei TaxID=2728851 RepID=A0A7Y0GAC1_9SPHN|nr:hypothetical protein [Novosphingobium olei]NML93774.1 hypothetical protein [Novosphingobium olei]